MRDRFWIWALGFGRRDFRAQRGMSLIEATVVLAVASMLAAVMAPSVRNYIQTAQNVTAQKDVETMAAVLSRMLIDVGESFILRNAVETATTDALAHGAPLHDTATNRVDLLVTEGEIPAVHPSIVRAVGTDWDDVVGVTAIQSLEYFLVLNTPSNNAANAYRTAATMDGTLGFDPDSGVAGSGQFNSEQAWRGPYLPGPIGADPWGNRYSVNVEFLARPLGTNLGNVNDVIVLSAGNNSLVETRFDIDGATSTNDVIAMVSGGTR